MKNPNLVIDIGQTFIKFIVINNNYKIIDHIIINNNLLIKRRVLNYNIIKLKNIIIFNTKKILRKHSIKKIISITHGSASFFINKKKEYFSGPHFKQRSTNYFDNSFFKKINKNDYTHSIKLEHFHNLGKSFYYLLKNKTKFKINKIITFPSLINFILTDKLFLDKSYLACHSFAWNFKQKKLINYFRKEKKIFPQIIESGKKIGNLKKEYFSKHKVEVFNGIHDTSGSYLTLKKNFNFDNAILINTGTYFIISKKVKFKSSIDKNFYYNYGADKNLYLCKRFEAGLIYQKFNPKMLFSKKKFNLTEIDNFLKNSKNLQISQLRKINQNNQKKDYFRLNFYIANQLNKRIAMFTNKKKIYKIIIDGSFVKNYILIYFLKYLGNYEIYLNNVEYVNGIGAATFLIKKKPRITYTKMK